MTLIVLHNGSKRYYGKDVYIFAFNVHCKNNNFMLYILYDDQSQFKILDINNSWECLKSELNESFKKYTPLILNVWKKLCDKMFQNIWYDVAWC